MEEKVLIIRGRRIDDEELGFIREYVRLYFSEGRMGIARRICERWGWRESKGSLKVAGTMDVLRRLERKGLIELPPPRNGSLRRKKHLSSLPLFKDEVNRSEVRGELKDFLPIELRVIFSKEEVCLFKDYIRRYHYLGWKPPVGENLKYMAYSRDGKLLACFLWGVAALKVEARDRFIGWDEGTRMRNLRLIANNSRFLILPWVHIPNLASHLLSMCTRVLSSHWERYYGHPVVLCETFVDMRRFSGTCYRAANWIYVGLTKGRGRNDRHTRRAESIKGVFLYPLRGDWKEVLRNAFL